MGRVLDGFAGLELDVVELAVDLLDLARVDVLDDVAGVGIDRDRPARARELDALGGVEERLAAPIGVTRLRQAPEDPAFAAFEEILTGLVRAEG